MLLPLALLAALLLAGGYVLQQHEAADFPDATLSPRLLVALAHRPVWLGGIATMVAGQVVGALALGLGSLVVVEPLLAANVLFALPLAALTSRRRLSRGDWAGAVMLVAGLVLFLLGTGHREGVDGARPSTAVWVAAGTSLAALVAVLVALSRGRSARVTAALLATSAGAMFGMQDFLTQRAILRLHGGVGALLSSWPPWVLLALAVAGLTFSQRAFGLADLSASLPAITLAEPVVGISLAIGAVGQGFPEQVLLLAYAAAGLALMLGGVVVLTRSPLVLDPHDRRRHRPHLPRHEHPVGSDRPRA